jgi:hypothetical protein
MSDQFGHFAVRWQTAKTRQADGKGKAEVTCSDRPADVTEQTAKASACLPSAGKRQSLSLAT